MEAQVITKDNTVVNPKPAPTIDASLNLNVLSSEVLKQYYEVFFPYKAFADWLTYFDKIEILKMGSMDIPRREKFAKRELSFTLKGDVYCRFQSFNNEKDLKKVLIEKTPVKMDIGAVYTFPPSSRTLLTDKQHFVPVEKEIVFDIDMTDYDDVRRCCKGTVVCNKCWKFMICASKILDDALRKDLGFQNLLWVFSGRRGIHCWVCDEKARKMTGPQRSAVASYIAISTIKTEFGSSMDIKDFKYPSIARATKIVKKYFEIIMNEQDFFADIGHCKKILGFVPEADRMHIGDIIEQEKTSEMKWKAFCREVKDSKIIMNVMFTYLYPRLDINVSKGFNHLLKSPFCIHPNTGNICVPLNIQAIEKFDPRNCSSVYKMLNSFFGKLKDCHTEDEKEYLMNHAWDATDAAENYKIFEAFLSQVKADSYIKKQQK